MLVSSIEKIEGSLADDALVLDVGGWAKPLSRADWVIDLMPYGTRGVYGDHRPELERFTHDSWVERDICDREPWPFSDDQFDFVVCSHTLEDVRDPVWVCSEINRVGRAGYIEVPSRLEEQAWGVAGEWAGWSHHHWLIDIDDGVLRFVFKPHVLHGRLAYQISPPLGSVLEPSERVVTMFWEEQFDFAEKIFFDADEFDSYLAGFVAEHQEALVARLPRRALADRVRAVGRRLRPCGSESRRDEPRSHRGTGA